jgi:hypothetical protein
MPAAMDGRKSPAEDALLEAGIEPPLEVPLETECASATQPAAAVISPKVEALPDVRFLKNASLP